MVQVGTTAFAADAWCHPTTVSLAGSMLAMDAPKEIMDFSDGYMSVITVTAGADTVGEERVAMCVSGMGTGAVCASATAGGDDGVMAANSLKSMMAAAGTWVPEGENAPENFVALPAGAAAVLAPAGVNNGVAPEATPEQIENEETPEAPEGEDLEGGLAAGASFSVTFYKPKKAATYAGLWRFEAGMMVSGYAMGNGDSANMNKKCMDATLTGASALVAGAAIAFGAAALF